MYNERKDQELPHLTISAAPGYNDPNQNGAAGQSLGLTCSAEIPDDDRRQATDRRQTPDRRVQVMEVLYRTEEPIQLEKLFGPGCYQNGYVVDKDELCRRLDEDGAVVLQAGYGCHFVLLQKGAYPDLEKRICVPNTSGGGVG